MPRGDAVRIPAPCTPVDPIPFVIVIVIVIEAGKARPLVAKRCWNPPGAKECDKQMALGVTKARTMLQHADSMFFRHCSVWASIPSAIVMLE